MNFKVNLSTLTLISTFIAISGCAQSSFNNLPSDSLGRSFCSPGIYDKSNTNGRYYSPNVDKCVEGKIFQKDHDLCIRGQYNTGQVDQARNYNPKVDQCVEGFVIPLTSGICLGWEGKNIIAREYFRNYQACKDGRVVPK